MILGSRFIQRVIDDSYCKSSEDYYFTEVGDYKIHCASLMPMIKFEEAEENTMKIDSSIFNNKEKLHFKQTIKTQNYLTARFVGRAPLKFYGPKTKFGEQFILICKNNNPSYKMRYFGTEDAIRGFNREANDSFILSKR